MTIGIYGGSFDPIHTGHAMIANFITQSNLVDEVWIMVSRQNPLKLFSTTASEAHRLKMAEIVALHSKKIKVSSLELTLPSPSFACDTLKTLREIYPENEFKWIIGSDNLKDFKNWKNHKTILKEFGLIVFPRPGFPLNGEEPEGMKFLTGAPECSLSSSLIREYIKWGWNINYFVPIEVADYIKKHDLYHG